MDETTMKERIGSFAEDGSVMAWPKRAANGTSYDRSNATLQGISGVHFVVLPINWQDEATLDALRALVAPTETATVETAAPKKGK